MNEQQDLEIVEERGLKFLCRVGSSDPKAIHEVVKRNAYRRKGFELAGRNWIDLGANIGAFAVLAGSQGCNVVAYEPDPVSYELMNQNIALNGLESKVQLVNAAVVASKVTTIDLHVNSANGNFWRNSVVKPWRGGYAVEVEAMHCDKVLKAGYDIKMDTEGSEMPVLEHWLTTGKKLPQRMVFEWSFDIDRSIVRFSKVIAQLRTRYEKVVYAKFDETHAQWPTTWFPPCRTVWCSE